MGSQIRASQLSSSISAILASSSSRLPVSFISASSSFSFIEHLLVVNGHARMIQESDVCYTTSMHVMSLKVDVSRTTLLYVIFEFVLLRITIIYLTKHRCIHVRNFVRKKTPYAAINFVILVSGEI